MRRRYTAFSVGGKGLTLVDMEIGDFGCESRGQGGHGEWPPSRAGPRATTRAQRRPSFHIGTRYTYTVEARSGHFEPDSARLRDVGAEPDAAARITALILRGALKPRMSASVSPS